MSRVAVVTGGASGMGLAICRRLAARGDKVAVVDLSGEAAEKAAAGISAIGRHRNRRQADVSDRPPSMRRTRLCASSSGRSRSS